MSRKRTLNQPKNKSSEQDTIHLHQSASHSEDEESPIKLLQGFLGATAFLTATLFYISWIYNRRYFEAFGISGYIIRYPAQDYILNAKSILSIGLLVVFLLFLLFLHPVLVRKGFRLSISLFSGAIFVAVSIYLFRDISVTLSQHGHDVVWYKTSWATSVSILTLLLYSTIAPTVLFSLAIASRKYRNFSRLVVWSGLAAMALLALSWVANFVGTVEGKLDTSVNSRLLSASIATTEPLGFGILADKITQDDGEISIYIYYNLRYLTQNEGLLYLFQPEQDIVNPLVHVIPIERAQVLSFGPNVRTLEPVFVVQTLPKSNQP